MKALFFYYKYPLYLQGSYFQEFLNALSGSLEKLYLVASRYPKGNFAKPHNVKIFWVPLLNIDFIGELFFMFAALLKVVFVKKLGSVDVVNSVGPRGLLAGWYLKKRYKIPLVCTVEMLNEKDSLANTFYYFFVRFLLTRAPIDKFICWSEYFWESQLKPWGVPKSKVTVIPGGINTKVYHLRVDGSAIKEKYAPRNPLIVFAKPLYSTNIEAAKLLVRAAALLKPEIEVRLLIGGGEGQSEVEKLAEDLGVLAQIAFMPLTPFPEIPKYVAAADLVVLPFTYAPTTSRSLIEAMTLGKPIITTSVGEVGKIIKDREQAVFANAVPEEIAVAIRDVLSDKELSVKMGTNARRLVEEKFSLQAVVKQTIKVFKGFEYGKSKNSRLLE